jgi:hypothetical protein
MKRNVLHFILDDLSPEHTRLPARTPHIDGLAQRGVRFGAAFCQFALCSPSRQSFFTGRSALPIELLVAASLACCFGGSCVCCSALLYRGTASRHWRRQRLVDEAEAGVEQQSSTS